MTWTEQHLWRELRKLDVNFRRQAPIGPYFADFATHNPKLIIEVDGGVHERLAEVALRDVERQRWLEAAGYVVLRFSDRRVRDDVYECMDTIRLRLAALGHVADGRLAPTGGLNLGALPPPPSPTLPPSRRKGEAP